MATPKERPTISEAQWKAGSNAYALHPDDAWVKVQIVEPDEVKQRSAVKDAAGRSWTVPYDQLQLSSASAHKGVDDMISLDVLHEGAIQENVQVRYGRHLIYTYVGTILVSINPYEIFDDLYTEETIGKFIEASKQGSEAPPHLFGVSDRVFNQMMSSRKNQSMLISGESGAGKTEATKHCLKYLTYKASDSDDFDGSNLIKQCIIDVNPVLEAFGNAKTNRNNNSSRFGKLFQVQFNAKGAIVGGNLISYLLEKSRVVSINRQERGYHIFYQMCKGCKPDLKAKLHLKECPDYQYLCQSGCLNIEDVDDVVEFEQVCTSMGKVGIDKDTQDMIFSVLAAILHLGNVTFKTVRGSNAGDGDKGEITSNAPLEHAAELLRVSSRSLKEALIVRTMGSGRGSVYKIPLTGEGASDSRDALCKELYSMLFEWLIYTINQSMSSKTKVDYYIAVLDIFGFEVFEKNSFEQLCINYANEVLHQQFIHHYFNLEQEEYKREGIPVEKLKIEDVDNVHVLKLMNAKPNSIFSILEEQCSIARGSDGNFIERLTDSLRKMNKDAAKLCDRVRSKPTLFVVKHFAGPVTYDTVGFIMKNKDPLHIDLQNVLNMSSMKHALVKQLLMFGTAKRKMNTTVVKTFQKNVTNLMNLLGDTEPNYVRCIKPNEQKKPKKFDGNLVLNQMRYSGLLDSVRIRQAGYAIRRKFLDIVTLFGNANIARKVKRSGAKKACQAILEEIMMPEGAFIMGRTQVFFKSTDDYAFVLNHVNEMRARAAVLIQAVWRAKTERTKFLHALSSVRWLKRQALTAVMRRRFLKKKFAIVKLQCNFRRLLATKNVEEKREARRRAMTAACRTRWEELQLCLEKTAKNVRRNGWLYKKGGQDGGRRNWKLRYFVLMDRAIAYYETDKLKGFKGRINLLDIEDVHCDRRTSFFFRDSTLTAEEKEIYVLNLTQKGKKGQFIVTAKEESDIEEWKTALLLMKKLRTLQLEAEAREDGLPDMPLDDIERMLTDVEIVTPNPLQKGNDKKASTFKRAFTKSFSRKSQSEGMMG